MIRKIITRILYLCLISNPCSASDIDNINWIGHDCIPYSFIHKNPDKKEGIAIDMLSAVFNKLGSKKSVQSISLEDYNKGLLQAKNTVNNAFFLIVKLPENEKDFKWFGPFDTFRPVVFAKKSRHIKINSVNDLKKYSIGVKSHAALFAMFNDLGVASKAIIETAGDKDSIKRLHENKLDLVGCGETPGLAIMKLLGYNPDDYEVVYRLKESELYVAFNKNTDDGLIKKLQKTLDEMKISKNGQLSEYDAILKHYISR